MAILLSVLLPVPRLGAEEPPAGGRLLLIQVDGLSMLQARRAMDEGRMPFLKKLESERGYRMRTMYTGMPSSTAAIQAELFYGVKTAVPAYGFKAHADDELVTMTSWQAAKDVEERLARDGAPLLKGGSVYSSIYTGGAAESYFCAMSARRGWDKPAFFARWMLRLLFYRPFGSLVVLARTFWEVVPAVGGVAEGVLRGYEFGQECYFIFKRVACVWLKEISALGARRDMAKGVPVVYVNFVGYDEASHRRGPSQIYARRFLKGIDRKIKSLHKWAEKRGYEVWVFSDHGQEDSVPYVKVHGRPLPAAVHELVRPYLPEAEGNLLEFLSIDMKEWTINYFGFGDSTLKDADLWIISMGPLAHVYLPPGMSAAQVHALARDLIEKAGVSLVFSADGAGQALVYKPEGRFVLPLAADEVFGAHPFKRDLVDDVIALVRHPDAGRLIISGWGGSPPMTLALEHGAHGSVGPNETAAFTLLPGSVDIRSGTRGGDYLRPLDLRRAVLKKLGRAGEVKEGNVPAIPKAG